MNAVYPAQYVDMNGAETTPIYNDGRTLRMQLRGVEFAGMWFDDFEPEEGTDGSMLTSFCLDRKMLCGCSIAFEMPIPVVAGNEVTEAQLQVKIILGAPNARGCLDREEIHLALRYAGSDYRGKGRSGWFEDELLEIQRLLPGEVYMKACINCAFSDYSPVGYGAFGCMACFRDNKKAYLKVKGKDIFGIWDTLTEYVQETYLCPEFELRTPGTGYRG